MSGFKKLHVYVLGHNEEQYKNIKTRDYLEFVRLDKLEVGEYQLNDFGENRFLYTGFEKNLPAEYVGTVTASWNTKNRYDFYGKYILMVDFLHELDLQPKTVWAPILALDDWMKYTEECHPGFDKYLKQLSEITGVTSARKTLWCSNFICHRDVMLDYVKFFKDTFEKVNAVHKWDYSDFYMSDYYTDRRSAAIGERITMYYFSSRDDLELKEPIV